MKTLYLILIGLLFHLTLAAQKRTRSNEELVSRYYQGTWFAKVNFGGFFDLQSPTFQPSIEYRINPRLSAELILGIPLAGKNDSRITDSTYLRYYKIKGELRFFPGNRFFYLGPQVFFTNRRQSKYNGIVVGKNRAEYDYQYAEMKKNIVGFIIKVGKIVPISEKWNVDGSVGFGPRLVSLKMNAVNLSQTPHYNRNPFYWRADKLGTNVSPHAEVMLRLSYTIR